MKHIVGGWGLTIFASLWRIAYENDMWLTTKSWNVFSNVIVFARCYWSSCQKVFCEESILKNFPKSAGKHLCWSAFLIKLKTSGWTFTKKRFLHRFFSCILRDFLEHLFCITCLAGWKFIDVLNHWS